MDQITSKDALRRSQTYVKSAVPTHGISELGLALLPIVIMMVLLIYTCSTSFTTSYEKACQEYRETIFENTLNLDVFVAFSGMAVTYRCSSSCRCVATLGRLMPDLRPVPRMRTPVAIH